MCSMLKSTTTFKGTWSENKWLAIISHDTTQLPIAGETIIWSILEVTLVNVYGT